MSRRTTFHAETPLQARLVEPALLLAKQLEASADAAPDGQVLPRVEALAVAAARALARQAVQATLQAQARGTEKAGRRPAAAPAAPASPGTRGRRRKQAGARWRVRRANRMATLCCTFHGDAWKTHGGHRLN